jgi:hypothetical protein
MVGETIRPLEIPECRARFDLGRLVAWGARPIAMRIGGFASTRRFADLVRIAQQPVQLLLTVDEMPMKCSNDAVLRSQPARSIASGRKEGGINRRNRAPRRSRFEGLADAWRDANGLSWHHDRARGPAGRHLGGKIGARTGASDPRALLTYFSFVRLSRVCRFDRWMGRWGCWRVRGFVGCRRRGLFSG